MQDLGGELRQAREKSGVSLEEISKRTLISKKYLLALEEGTHTVFPGEVYLKGALRKYAAEVGLSPELLLARYDEMTNKEKPQIEPVPEKTVTIPEISPTLKKNIGRYATITVVLLFAVFAVRAAYIGLMKSIDSPGEPPSHNNFVPDEEAPADDLPLTPEEPEIPEPEQMRIERDSREDRVLFNVFNTDSLDVELVFTGRCWIRVEADNAHLFEKNFSAGDTEFISADNAMRISIGNPLGINVVVGGEKLELPETNVAYSLFIAIAEE